MAVLYYRAFGLVIESEFALPAKPIDDLNIQVDVSIRRGAIADTVTNYPGRSDGYALTKDRFIMNVDDVARYLITEGRQIIVDPYEAANEGDIRLYLLGTAFAALMYQRQYLVFHGSAIMIGGLCTIFTGHPGTGKSTLAAVLHKKGYPVLADDICMIRLNRHGQPEIVPEFPRIKLWADSADWIGQDVHSMAVVSDRFQKYLWQLESSPTQEARPVNRIYELNVYPNAELKIRKLAGIEKLDTVVKNTIRFIDLGDENSRALHFNQSVTISQTVDVFKVFRPRNGNHITEMVEALEHQWN